MAAAVGVLDGVLGPVGLAEDVGQRDEEVRLRLDDERRRDDVGRLVRVRHLVGDGVRDRVERRLLAQADRRGLEALAVLAPIGRRRARLVDRVRGARLPLQLVGNEGNGGEVVDVGPAAVVGDRAVLEELSVAPGAG